LLLWARLVGDIDRLLHNRQRNSTRPQHGAQQQMLVVPLFLQLIKRLKTVCLKIFVSSLLELTSKTDDSWGN